jgi:hypothetical protein
MAASRSLRGCSRRSSSMTKVRYLWSLKKESVDRIKAMFFGCSTLDKLLSSSASILSMFSDTLFKASFSLGGCPLVRALRNRPPQTRESCFNASRKYLGYIVKTHLKHIIFPCKSFLCFVFYLSAGRSSRTGTCLVSTAKYNLVMMRIKEFSRCSACSLPAYLCLQTQIKTSFRSVFFAHSSNVCFNAESNPITSGESTFLAALFPPFVFFRKQFVNPPQTNTQ